MFYKKRRAEQKQQRLDAYARKETALTNAIVAAGKIVDPAVQIVKLAGIERDIAACVHQTTHAAKYARNMSLQTGGAWSGLGMAFGGAALLPVLPHVGAGIIIAAYPTALGGVAGNIIYNKRMRTARVAEQEEHVKRMKALLKQAGDIKEHLVKTRVEDILQSPSYEKVLKLPGLSEAFAGAAARQIAQLNEKLAAEKEKAARAQGQAQRPAPSLGDYGKFKNVMRK